ncbi:hypothetical protein C5167_004717 [Papaver somniferum]|uniref:Uncharacterized protein n=1 Tax=Papaver somniferum TaxID=3469 RepID=A0A4Y7J9C6_PAPSO|nr:hypothetical protein C5167_004717 [Papaver somniferum]
MMAMNQPPPLPPDIPEVMRISVMEIGGTKPVYWLFEKTLRRSDVSPRQGRIFISQAVRDLLTPAEHRKYWVLQGQMSNSKEKKEFRVTLVEPDGTKSEIDFKIWCWLL